MDLAPRFAARERTILFVLLCAFCAWGVFDHSLWAPNDSREGAMVWDMFRSGDWTKLSLNGAPFLEKPPLLHWTSLALCRAFGHIDEGLLRLPAALYGLGALLIVAHWGRTLGRERGGWLGACLCATTLLYAEYSRIVLTDICLTFMVTLSLHTFWLAYSAASRRVLRYAAFLAVSALSFYAKGVLGPGLVIVSVVAFLALRREWKLAIVLPLAFAPCLAAAIVPWAVALYREGGREYLVSAFIDNQLGRFFALPRGANVTSMPLIGGFLGFMADRPLPADPYLVHKEPFYFYLVKLPIFWMPWTLLVPGAVWHWFKRASPVVSPLATLLRCALLVIAIVLQVASAKVACYALPLYPILFLMVGVWCDDVLSAARSRFAASMARATAVLVGPLLVLLPCAYLVLFTLPREADRWIDARSALLEPPSTWLWTAGAGVAWRGAFLCTAALACAVLGLGWVRASNAHGDRAGGTLKLVAVLMVVTMLTSSAVIPAWDFQRTYKPMAELARAEIAAGRRVALAVGEEKDVGAFNFYTDARLPEVSLIPGAREFLQQGIEPRGVVVHAADVGALVSSLAGLDHEVREVRCPSGQKSKQFRLVTRGEAAGCGARPSIDGGSTGDRRVGDG